MYIKKTVILTTTKEIFKTCSYRYGNHNSHAGNVNPTPQEVHRYNEKIAEQKLRWLLNANFHPGDYHVVLTYKKDQRPEAEECMKLVRSFLGKIKRRYKKEGYDFKWVLVTEYMNKAIHHHLVCNTCPLTMKFITECWPHGRPHYTPLDESNDYAALAHYLIKETRKTYKDERAPHKQRYTHSRGNIVIPEPKIEIIKAESWRAEPKAPKGWYVVKDSIREGISEMTGFPYQHYTLARLGAPPGEYDFD